MNEENKKLDGMESSKSKRNAHCMYGHDMTDAHKSNLSHDAVCKS